MRAIALVSLALALLASSLPLSGRTVNELESPSMMRRAGDLSFTGGELQTKGKPVAGSSGAITGAETGANAVEEADRLVNAAPADAASNAAERTGAGRGTEVGTQDAPVPRGVSGLPGSEVANELDSAKSQATGEVTSTGTAGAGTAAQDAGLAGQPSTGSEMNVDGTKINPNYRPSA